MRFERDVMEVREDESCCSARWKKAEARTRRFGFAPHVNRERKSGAKRRQNPSVAGRSKAGGDRLDPSIFAVSERSHYALRDEQWRPVAETYGPLRHTNTSAFRRL